MQIVEDIRDGSDANPPSSPGHADEQISSDLENGKDKNKEQEAAPTENGHLIDNEPMHSQDEDTAKAKEDVHVKEEEEENKLNKEGGKCKNDTTENIKRKLLDNEDTPSKRLRPDIEDQHTTRDKILNEEIMECNGLDQIMTYSEQILAEIKALNDLAREKEREWNHLIYLKKLKEELLIRLQRKRQILLLNETNFGEVPLDALTQSSLSTFNQKPNLLKMTNFEKSIPSSVLHKPSQVDLCSSLDFKQKQRPILDVQSIIADYRQRHPESVPRRGRRIRQGSGQKEADYQSEIGMILNHMNGIRNKSISQTQDYCNFTENTPYRDLLVEFAKLSEREKEEVRTEIKKSHKPPPPYPEVTVHPVTTTNTAEPTSSLLHGILTKASRKLQKNNTNNPPSQISKSSFSPCLARLLTVPEKNNAASTTSEMDGNLGNNNMSLSEILSNTITKARNEITITPVAEYETNVKNMEEEFEEGPDRLIIDESSDIINLSGKTDSSETEEVPQCQGCHQKAALFVCAGCGNQWYCSRDCQVEAWDAHSEVCSG